MIESPPQATARWDLTAPESLVLRDGPGAKPAEVIKVAVLELVTRRVLRLVEVQTRGWRGKPKTEVVLGIGSRPAPTDGPLERVATIALETKAQTYPDGTLGVAMSTFARAFVASYKNAPKLYVEQAVLPALERRGLYASERRKWLKVVPHTHWQRTPAGDRALAQLTELTTTAERDAAEWSERAPGRLAGFLATAGGAALLAPAAFPVFEEFAHRLRAQSDDASFVPVIAATTVPDDDAGADLGGTDLGGADFGGAEFGGADFGGVDLSGLDFSALSIDFSSMSGLDGALASIDAGISAGVSGDGGGSGADGGGGAS